ncbi:Metallo-dependent hydrolase [Amylostereum chailletii]|nr:Metallo-dependent hydrolase [Amylostereum chailletii]
MLFQGDFVHFPELGRLEIIRNHLLAVDNQGYISHFASSDTRTSIQLLDGSGPDVTKLPLGEFFLPTFCDLHLHAPQFLYQGTGLDLPLMTWLFEYAYRAELRLDSDAELAKRVYSRLAERLIEHGTGAALLFGTIKTETNLILAQTMYDIGIRAFVGKLSMDQSSLPEYTEHTASSALTAAESFIDRINQMNAPLQPHARLVEPVVTPRFVPTCSDELLHGLGELASRTGTRIQSHLAEAHDQVEYVRRDRGAEDSAVFGRAQLLTSRTVQAHCTFLSGVELSHLASCGTAIAHCPLSNAYFSSRPFPLREALSRGVRVGLGTDIAGGYNVDIMSSMRWAAGVSRIREGVRAEGASPAIDESAHALRVDWKESMFLATRGGAEALGLQCGVFRVGAPFDAQSIRLFDKTTQQGVGPLDFFDLGPIGKAELSEEMIEKWWCVGDVRNRTGVWIQGKRIGSW